jgi:hypothetical protein
VDVTVVVMVAEVAEVAVGATATVVVMVAVMVAVGATATVVVMVAVMVAEVAVEAGKRRALTRCSSLHPFRQRVSR